MNTTQEEVHPMFYREIVPPKDRRTKWGELSFRIQGPRLSIDCLDDDHLTLIVGLVFVTLYIKLNKFLKSAEHMETSYGFYFQKDAFVFCWDKKRKFFYFPWSWDFYRRWEMVEGGWVAFPTRTGLKGPFYGDLGTKGIFDYRYTLRSGEIQERKATVSVDRMEWRWRWLKWLPFPRKRVSSIWIKFDGEVGDRTGSWKGGVTGCGETLRPGESPYDAFRRMERDRQFK